MFYEAIYVYLIQSDLPHGFNKFPKCEKKNVNVNRFIQAHFACKYPWES